MEEEKKDRDLEIHQQKEYIRLRELQDAEREAEIKRREDKAKAFMAMMSDTVIQDQKE